jgi:acyl-CoA thioester hydrolase
MNAAGSGLAAEAPLVTCECTVLPEWIDYNGHMNVAWYVYAFDLASVALMDRLGLGDDYRATGFCSTFALESHILYQRELVEGDPIRITTQLIDFDPRRIHYFHRMLHGERGHQAATLEQLSIHVDRSGPKAAPMPALALQRLESLRAAHAALPVPEEAGRSVGIRRKA